MTDVPPELGRLSTFIDSHAECLAGSSSELRSIALCAVKHVFDWALATEGPSRPHLETLLATLTDTAPPQTRSRVHDASIQQGNPSSIHKRQKRINVRETPLPSLFIEGMNVDQIWQQLDLRAARVCENLQALQGEDEDEDANSSGEDSDNDASKESDTRMDIDEEDEECLWDGLSGEEEEGSIVEGVIDLQDEVPDEDDQVPRSMVNVARGQQKLRTTKLGPQEYPELDDDFFNLAAFNAETNEVEKTELSKKKQTDTDEDSESDIDIFGAVDDAGSEDAGDSSALFYKDFFEPPQRNPRPSKVRFHEQVSVKKIKAVGKGMPVSSMADEDSDSEEEEEENI